MVDEFIQMYKNPRIPNFDIQLERYETCIISLHVEMGKLCILPHIDNRLIVYLYCVWDWVA